MSWNDAIVWLASLIGAISAIVVAVKKVLKPFLTAQEQINEISVDVKELMKHDEEQRLSILRLVLMSPEIPVSERIIAGDKYIKLGGNGDCKQYYFDLLKQHTK